MIHILKFCFISGAIPRQFRDTSEFISAILSYLHLKAYEKVIQKPDNTCFEADTHLYNTISFFVIFFKSHDNP
jgi:hypothetical protein